MLVPLLRCRRCNEEKLLSEFDRSYFGKNGYDVYCHNCRIEIDNIQNSITEKTCRQCGRTKPISEFGKNASIRDGYNKECLDCQDDNHRRKRNRKYKDKWDGKLAICRICRQQKPTYEFIKPRYSNEGYEYCRSCISEITRNKVLRFEQEREEKGWPLEKTCKECGRLLPSDHFHLDRRQKDGLAVKCRNCFNQNERQRLKKLKEKHRLNKLNKNSRKECSICHNLKPLSNFSKNESTLDGLSEICKFCIKKVREESIKYWKEERAKKDEKIKTKQCKNCGRILSIDMFSKNRERKKGYYNICKDCTRVERIAAEKRWEAQRKKKLFEFSFDIITEKKCRLCGKILPVSDFYRRRSSKDGYGHYCKNCDKKKSEEYINRLKKRDLTEDMLPDKKKCVTCGMILPRYEFSRNLSSSDGLCSQCKKCYKKYYKEYSKRPEVQKKNREYCRRPEVKERKRKQKKKYYMRPEVKKRKNAYSREYRKRPYVKERRRKYDREYSKRPEVKQKRKERDSRPEAKARRRESTRKWRMRKKAEKNKK